MKIKIEGRTVILVGPKSTGKSGIVKKLLFQNPVGRGLCVPYKITQTDSQDIEKLRETAKENISQAIKNGFFLVINCEGVSSEEVKSIIEFCQSVNFFRKIQVIKVNLSTELHNSFRRRNHEKISKEFMLEERKSFEDIVNTKYTDLNVYESIITNPGNTFYEF